MAEVVDNTTTNKRQTTNNRGQKKSRVQFSTYDGHPLTANEARFIDEYIKTSNIRQSYLNAYENANPKTAAQRGQTVFNKEYIAGEIQHRLEQMKSESIADADEIMRYFTSVMRGEVKDQFGLEAPLSERTKAAQELAKRKIDIQQKLAGNEQPEVRIVLDWGRSNETNSAN